MVSAGEGLVDRRGSLWDHAERNPLRRHRLHDKLPAVTAWARRREKPVAYRALDAPDRLNSAQKICKSSHAGKARNVLLYSRIFG